MGVFILTWKEGFYEGDDPTETIAATAKGRAADNSWSTGVRKQGIAPGDIGFMMRLGTKRGLVAVGEFQSEIYQHRAKGGRAAPRNFANVRWSRWVHADDRVPVEILKREVPDFAWDRLQASGIEVAGASAKRLLRVWRRYAGAGVPGPSGGAATAGENDYIDAPERFSTKARDPFAIDPDKVDRGLAGHSITQNKLAARLRFHNLRPLPPVAGDPNFDLAWKEADGFVVAEVKSMTEANETGQLRLGLGQVLDFRDAMQRRRREPCRAVLAVETKPRDATRWVAVCSAVGVELVWPSTFDRAIRSST